jgi:acidic leucine-rich nuclear phosphoprotein 32 family protein A/C/D
MKRIEMNLRIEQQLKGQTRCVTKELNLDMCRAQQIEGLTDEFVNLQVLSMNNVGLITLDGFPRLPALRKLELSDNRLSGGLMNLVGCPNLTYLNLSGNKIKDLNQLEPLVCVLN